MSTRGDVAAMRALIAEHNEKLAAESPAIAFSAEEYRDRLSATRTAMSERGIDVLVVMAPDNMCYLHGYASRWYHGHSPTVWPSVAATVVHVDSDTFVHFDSLGERGLLQSTSIAQDIHFFAVYDDHESVLASFVGELRARGWLPGRVGVELWSHVPNRAVSERIERVLTEGGASIVDATSLLRAVRGIKSAQEVAYIEEGARIADIGLEAARDAIRPGVTELEVWGAMMHAIAKAGGEPAAIHELVRVGSIEEGHAIASRRKIAPGDYVVVDPCGVVNHYHGNTSRTFYVGEPPAAALELTRIAGAAFDVLCAVAKDGTPVDDVNRALREFFVDAGIWDLRAWVGGYELGLSFPPDWVGEFVFTVEDEAAEGAFKAGMVTNFESIFHLPVLDTIIYEPDGARALSRLPRELLAVPC